MYFGGVSGHREAMQLPNGIAIDSKNNIYVADYAVNHVNQYALINTTASDAEAPSAPAANAPDPRPSAAVPAPAAAPQQ